MPHNEAGVMPEHNALLTPDWHTTLTDKQVTAYMRHAYIWRQTGALSKTSPEQARKHPRWDGGTDAYGVKFTAVWPRITRMVRAVGADPGIWVAAHFSPCGYSKFINTKNSFDLPDIAPTFLCSSASEQIYTEYCSEFPRILVDAYNAAGRAISLRMRSLQKLNISEEDRYLCVLADESNVSASPFIRQGFANFMNVPDIVERYLRPAAFDFEAKQRLYETVIPRAMPAWLVSDKLMKLVGVIRKHWSQYA
jgi:hypothetical protein